MNLIIGEDIWDELDVADAIFVCAGSLADKQGRVILDRGEGTVATKHFKWMPVAFGELLHRRKKQKKLYGIMHAGEICLPECNLTTIPGLFQTHDNQHGPVNDAVVKNSVRMLSFWSDKWERIALEFPTWRGQEETKDKSVLNLLEALPDNVFVYKEK